MSTPDEVFDIAIVGGGIVGVSIAYFAAPLCKVLILEAEAAAGYHATGRSAATFTSAYGPRAIRALARTSRFFFDQPPDGFTTAALLRHRGELFVGSEDQQREVRRLYEELVLEGKEMQLLNCEEIQDRVPVLKPSAATLGVYDNEAFDIDVDALLQGFLKGARTHGAVFSKNSRVTGVSHRHDKWYLETEQGESFQATTIVNCAGAWVDQVAALAGVRGIGIEPRRRSAFLFDPPPGELYKNWPLVAGIDETWYFKPEAGLLFGSPANADLVLPHDVFAEDLDIALGIYNIEEVTTLKIGRPKSTWAGLRSFVADGEPVCGFDDRENNFFWAAAVGGYGIQIAPAFGRLCACLLLKDLGFKIDTINSIDLDVLAPHRESINRVPL